MDQDKADARARYGEFRDWSPAFEDEVAAR